MAEQRTTVSNAYSWGKFVQVWRMSLDHGGSRAIPVAVTRSMCAGRHRDAYSNSTEVPWLQLSSVCTENDGKFGAHSEVCHTLARFGEDLVSPQAGLSRAVLLSTPYFPRNACTPYLPAHPRIFRGMAPGPSMRSKSARHSQTLAG